MKGRRPGNGGGPNVRVGLIGKDKDASSYYLREFPQRKLVDVQQTKALSATELRLPRFLYLRTA